MITDGSETQPPQPLSKLLSKKEKLLTITALSGEFPCDNFHRLHISSSYAKLLRHNLYQEGMIKSLSDDCLKGLVLTSKGIEVLKQKTDGSFQTIPQTAFCPYILFSPECRYRVPAGQKAVCFCPQTLAAVYCRFSIDKAIAVVGCSCFLQLHRDKI